MNLNKLIADFTEKKVYGDTNIEISAVVYDSRKVVPDSLFVCIKGYSFDGHSYIEKAIEEGATAIVLQDMPEKCDASVTYIQVEDTREALALLAAAWFDYPARKLTMIGLTGTKGKTTTAHMIKKILEEDGKTVGMIGTIGAYIGDEKIPTKNTTPESYELHALFDQMLQKGCTHVVMEVSSQGLKLKRTHGIQFHYGAFLNISPDHISPNEHKDFDEYMNCKKMMFSQCDLAVVNTDADLWEEITCDCKNRYTISCEHDADIIAQEIQNKWAKGFLGVSYKTTGKLSGEFGLNMPGVYNVQNALIASTICACENVDNETMNAALAKVSVRGRTEVVREVADITTVVIDYAHNAISTMSLLSTLKAYEPKRLICIFGGGGNKPKQRRFDMGQAAGKYADHIIITMDNPRFESMDAINADIIKGIDSENGSYQIIDDRQEAIEYMLDNAKEDDIIALIGKGHEEYQEVNGEKFYFSEIEVIRNYMSKR